MVGAPRHAVQGVERTHRGIRAGLERRLEWREIEIEQAMDRHVGRVVVTT